MEMIGFKVDSVFVQNWIAKHTSDSPSLDAEVINFMLESRAEFMKEKALRQYRISKNPIEKLEYKLNSLIGPKKLHDRILHAHE